MAREALAVYFQGNAPFRVSVFRETLIAGWGERKMDSPTPRSLWHNMDSCDSDNEARDRKHPRKGRGPDLGRNGRPLEEGVRPSIFWQVQGALSL